MDVPKLPMVVKGIQYLPDATAAISNYWTTETTMQSNGHGKQKGNVKELEPSKIAS
jgi:hypothetical protein